MFLEILISLSGKRNVTRAYDQDVTDSSELVEFDKHDSLLVVEMTSYAFSDVRYQCNHHRERLRGEGCSNISARDVRTRAG